MVWKGDEPRALGICPDSKECSRSTACIDRKRSDPSSHTELGNSRWVTVRRTYTTVTAYTVVSPLSGSIFVLLGDDDCVVISRIIIPGTISDLMTQEVDRASVVTVGVLNPSKSLRDSRRCNLQHRRW